LEEWHYLVREKFYDSGVLEAYNCIIDSLMLSSPPGTVRRLFLAPEPLGSGQYGIAATIDLNGTVGSGVDNQVLVEKASTRGDLAHELAIALFATNKLRRIDPGYAYYFRGSKCSPPGLDNSKKHILTWCTQNSFKAQLAILEGVPGKIWGKWIQTATIDQVISGFFSLMTTLLVGQQQCGFVHFDSNDQNIIMRPTPGRFVRRLWNGVMINVDFVPTLIDFGMSRAVVNINGKDQILCFQGGVDPVDGHVISNQYFADFHATEDIGRTLGWTMYHTRRSRPDLYPLLAMMGNLLFPQLEQMSINPTRFFFQLELEPKLTLSQYWDRVISLPVIDDWFRRNMIRQTPVAPPQDSSDVMQVLIQLGFPLNGQIPVVDLADVATIIRYNPERRQDFNEEQIYTGASQEAQRLSFELSFPVIPSDWNSIERAGEGLERTKELMNVLAILVPSFPSLSSIIDQLSQMLKRRTQELDPLKRTLLSRLPLMNSDDRLRTEALSFV
jgi:hypothetical protein